jgi:DNA-binding beta-propeller fold protein YncE
LRWNSSGITVAGVTGQSGIASNHLTLPFGVVIDYTNTLYISDYGCNRVQRWLKDALSGSTVAGQENCTYGADLTQLIAPAGILVDSDSNLYIADSGNSRVLFWPKDATSGKMIAGTGK